MHIHGEKRRISRLVGGLLLLILAGAGVAAFAAGNSAADKPAVKQQAGSVPLNDTQLQPERAVAQTVLSAAKANPAVVADPYAVEPEPLTIAQCGQCHPGIFRNLRIDGGRHKIDCQNCHRTFHAYSPRKNNWDELMPKCATCHTLPHGNNYADCLECHVNPHTPAKVPMSLKLIAACGDCHKGPAADLKQFPSGHARLECHACHSSSHGYIPSCSACHKPHYEEQEFTACTPCHPVHKPKEIIFNKDSGALTCGACHSPVYQKWEKTPSRHGKVNCTICHTRHGLIPKCADCHGTPHNAVLHERFPKCLTCHQDVHDIPVKERVRR